MYTEMNSNVDVVFILDSCYSGKATRAVGGPGRIVEVLAAVEADQTAFRNSPEEVRTQYRTFTSKIADYVSRKRGKGETVELAEMIACLRQESPTKKPVHAILLGPNSIRLGFPGSRNLSVAPSANFAHRVVFSVHVADALTPERVKTLVEWVLNLDPSLNIMVDAVYETESTGLIVEAPYSLFSKLSGMPGIQLLLKTRMAISLRLRSYR